MAHYPQDNNYPYYGGSMQAMPVYDPSKLDASYAMGPQHSIYNYGAPAPNYNYNMGGSMVASRVLQPQMMYGTSQPQHFHFPQQGEGNLRSEAGIVRDVIHGEHSMISERITEQRGNDYYIEKFVEAPTTIVKEREREVRKPAIIERIIEEPKPELRYIDRPMPGGPFIIDQEQIVEVPQIVTEEIVTRVPRKEIQERLIEIPKIEYVERIEYDDQIEYREVCVDKIVEVPEIEYHVREVEKLVPQTYIEEYFVDNYREVPMYQVQEVQRVEHVPVARQAPVVERQVMMVPHVEQKKKGKWVYQEDDVVETTYHQVPIQQQVGTIVEKVNQAPTGGHLTYGYAPNPSKAQLPAQSSGALYPSATNLQPSYGALQPSYGSYAAYDPSKVR